MSTITWNPLVVERQHLHRDQLERHECHRGQQQYRHAPEKERAHPAARDERVHQAPIETRKRSSWVAVVGRGRATAARRHHEGHGEREDHRC
jgi:hypothetical protein